MKATSKKETTVKTSSSVKETKSSKKAVTSKKAPCTKIESPVRVGDVIPVQDGKMSFSYVVLAVLEDCYIASWKPNFCMEIVPLNKVITKTDEFPRLKATTKDADRYLNALKKQKYATKTGAIGFISIDTEKTNVVKNVPAKKEEPSAEEKLEEAVAEKMAVAQCESGTIDECVEMNVISSERMNVLSALASFAVGLPMQQKIFENASPGVTESRQFVANVASFRLLYLHMCANALKISVEEMFSLVNTSKLNDTEKYAVNELHEFYKKFMGQDLKSKKEDAPKNPKKEVKKETVKELPLADVCEKLDDLLFDIMADYYDDLHECETSEDFDKATAKNTKRLNKVKGIEIVKRFSTARLHVKVNEVIYQYGIILQKGDLTSYAKRLAE